MKFPHRALLSCRACSRNPLTGLLFVVSGFGAGTMLMRKKIFTSAFAAVLLIALGSLTSQRVAAAPIGMVVDNTGGKVHVFDAGNDTVLATLSLGAHRGDATCS